MVVLGLHSPVVGTGLWAVVTFCCTICRTTQLYLCSAGDISLSRVTWRCIYEWQTWLAKECLASCLAQQSCCCCLHFFHLSHGLGDFSHWDLNRCFCCLTFCYCLSKIHYGESMFLPEILCFIGCHREVLSDCYSFWFASLMISICAIEKSKGGAVVTPSRCLFTSSTNVSRAWVNITRCSNIFMKDITLSMLILAVYILFYSNIVWIGHLGNMERKWRNIIVFILFLWRNI